LVVQDTQSGVSPVRSRALYWRKHRDALATHRQSICFDIQYNQI
jgi:hypothetical protein